MKAAIYCRVSTEGQEQDGTSIPSFRLAGKLIPVSKAAPANLKNSYHCTNMGMSVTQ